MMTMMMLVVVVMVMYLAIIFQHVCWQRLAPNMKVHTAQHNEFEACSLATPYRLALNMKVLTTSFEHVCWQPHIGWQ